MLSQQDIDQFRTIVSEEVAKRTEGIKNKVDQIEIKVGQVETQVNRIPQIQKDMKSMQTDMRKIHKDINTIINFFDRDTLELRGRVERIEKHLGLQALS